jgi:DNA (cytosine-5)-methyltransferase 3A
MVAVNTIVYLISGLQIKMKVLSLFDGISCLRVALGDRAVEYYASEIDKNAIKISHKNYPSIKQLGSVCDVSGMTGIDLLVGGSPCTDLSIAKKERKGLEGDRSKLFYEYVRIWRETKPTWFILENVASMPTKDKDIITSILGVEPIMINASLVSAQTRKRLFWTNIPVKGQPADRGILLKDILESNVSEKFFSSQRSIKVKKQTRSPDDKAICLTASSHKGVGSDGMTVIQGLKQIGHISCTNGQANRVYDPEGKSTALTALSGGGGAKTGLYMIGRVVGRRLTEDGKRDDTNLDREYKQVVETRTDEKTNNLSTVAKDNIVIGNNTIRRLTPLECERLQSLPDNYTAGVSDTARYKALGNAFNVEVIKFILSFLP